MMDKRFLDPRRPLGTPTAEDKAEMLIPYAAELPVSLQSFASHQRQVANLKGAQLPCTTRYCQLPILCSVGKWVYRCSVGTNAAKVS